MDKVYRVSLRDTQTGFEDTIEYAAEPEAIHLVWEDGNNSCDCNRSYFLYPNDPEKWCECGDSLIELVKIEEKQSG